MHAHVFHACLHIVYMESLHLHAHMQEYFELTAEATAVSHFKEHSQDGHNLQLFVYCTTYP